jgi:hypothetical protein
VIPTDSPEADGTLVSSQDVRGLARIREQLPDVAAGEYSWTLPDSGHCELTPDPDRVGLGLDLRTGDAEQYRRA